MLQSNDRKNEILNSGLAMADTLGFECLTIGELAKSVKMSKSGLFAHFKSKENLQIAVLEHTAQLFVELVLRPALKVERGFPRIRVYIEKWIDWDSNRFHGGCVLVSALAEYADRPGRVKDFLLKLFKLQLDSFKQLADSAIKAGHFRSDIDREQFAYELHSLLHGFNSYQNILNDELAIKHHKLALDQLLIRYQK